MPIENKVRNLLEQGQVPNSRGTYQPAASGSVNISLADVLNGIVTANPPATGSGTVVLPAAALWPMRFVNLKCTSTAGGELIIASHGSDKAALSVGDNISAAADYVLLFSDGEQLFVIKEVTT